MLHNAYGTGAGVGTRIDRGRPSSTYRRPFFGFRGLRVRCSRGESPLRRLSTPPRAPSGIPSRTGQLKIPTPRELERLRQFRHQQQQRQQQLHQQGSAPGKRAEPEQDGLLDRALYAKMAKELGLAPAWRPQVSLLYQVGLRGSELAKLAEARKEVFLIKPPTMRRKLRFFREAVGLSDEELAKMLTRFPRILEYQVDRTLRKGLDFLKDCGVPDDEIAKVVVRAPMLLELSVGKILERRAAFLTEQLALGEGELGKLVVRHPQLLTCTEDMLGQRVAFLGEQGLSQQQIGRAVMAHPQVLHYKIESMRDRVSYLRSIGMTGAQVAAAVCRFPQLFSLSVESNLAPKWRYLVEHLGGDVATLCAYPGYFSLSLSNRIIPRLLFYQRCKPKAPLPFPMCYLKCADKRYATEGCGSTLQEYEEFKAALEAQQAEQAAQQAEQARSAGAQEQPPPPPQRSPLLGGVAPPPPPPASRAQQQQQQEHRAPQQPGRSLPATSGNVLLTTQLGGAVRRVGRASPSPLPAAAASPKDSRSSDAQEPGAQAPAAGGLDGVAMGGRLRARGLGLPARREIDPAAPLLGSAESSEALQGGLELRLPSSPQQAQHRQQQQQQQAEASALDIPSWGAGLAAAAGPSSSTLPLRLRGRVGGQRAVVAAAASPPSPPLH